jgi:hypothetical protein
MLYTSRPQAGPEFTGGTPGFAGAAFGAALFGSLIDEPLSSSGKNAMDAR